MSAVAIISPNTSEKEADGYICILSDITCLPEKLLKMINERFPFFRLEYSNTTESEYYANTCPSCGMLSGDFFLHNEPGRPFFPETKEEAQELMIEQLPVKIPIEIDAGYHVGPGELIMEHGKRKTL
jgi:hypothetical protein